MFGFFEEKVTEIWNVVAPEPSELDKYFNAIKSRNIDQINLFLSSLGPNCLNKGIPAFFIVCETGNIEIIQLFQQYNVDSTIKSQTNDTILHYTAKSANLEAIQYVLSEFPNISIMSKNDKNQTCYDIAKGFAVKQHLMKLVLKENVSKQPILGVSRDIKKDEERLKNLGPPPIEENFQQRSQYTRRDQSKAIKENDGFVKTVENPELSKKYGNNSSFSPFQLKQNEVKKVENIGQKKGKMKPNYASYNGIKTIQKQKINLKQKVKQKNEVKIFNPALKLKK